MPIDIDKLESFDPLNVPGLVDLCDQLERGDMINLDKKIKGKNSIIWSLNLKISNLFYFRLQKDQYEIIC